MSSPNLGTMKLSKLLRVPVVLEDALIAV